MENFFRNPFVITPYVREEYFCDRTEETAQLCKHLLNGRNVALFARRRLGKTGLIRHCFAQKEISDVFNTFLIDIYAANNLKEMVAIFANEIFSKSEYFGIKDKLLQGLKSLRPQIEYSQLTDSLSFSPIVGDISYPDKTLEELMQILDSGKRPCVIAIDEFQKIRDFKEANMEAYLRTVVQKCRNIIFIFTGSITHSMTNMFTSPAKPFYNSAVQMTIDVIDRDVYRDFAQMMFRKYGRGKKIDDALIYLCYDYFNGITWYVQLIMNEAFAMAEPGKTISEADFHAIHSAIIAQQHFSYNEQFSRYSEKQKSLLQALALEGPAGANITSNAFLSKYALGSASSIQTACRSLMKLGVIAETDGKKHISDLIFSEWLRRNLV